MPQHFLLSPVARSFADDEVQLALNDNEPLAYALFMLFRWGSLTEQVCPRCGAIDAHMPRPLHKQWRCRSCRHDFSLKSGSLIDGTKLPYWKIVKALYLWSAEPKGMSAVAISRRCGIGYEASYLLLHKFRWAFWNRPVEERLTGAFEVDVVWVLKGFRKANDRTEKAIEARNEKRRAALGAEFVGLGMSAAEAEKKAARAIPKGREPRGSNPKKQPILAIVQRHENGTGVAKGSKFVVGFPVPSESYEHVAPIVRRFIEPGSKIVTDGASAYIGLAADYELEQVDHDEFYSKGDGLHTNFVESAFSRWRRMEIGTHHRMNPRTLHLFFADCAWRETERRTPPAEQFEKALFTVAHEGVCRTFKKYGYTPRERGRRSKPLEIKPQERATPEAVKEAANIFRLAKAGDAIGRFVQQVGDMPDGTVRVWNLGARRVVRAPAESSGARWSSVFDYASTRGDGRGEPTPPS